MITRELQSVIESKFYLGKAIVLLGARQVGKTTLIKTIAGKSKNPVLFLNCDEPETCETLSSINTSELKLLLGNNKLVIIDEAQKVANIGTTLKLIVDNFTDVQVVATGSSSFDLRNKLNEPLTGRKYEYTLFPISTSEIITSFGLIDAKKTLESRLIYGSYPDIFNRSQDVQELLFSLVDSYLYKDILSLETLRKPTFLNKLLIALALQVGNEVSYNELAISIGSDSKTVEKYIDLLEKCFVVFRLNALSRNLRNELKKGKKVYFWDNGVLNAIIQNFSSLSLRQDAGALWENFFISERMKYNHYNRRFVKSYFWRTVSQQEIDYVEEYDGMFDAFELKWNPARKVKFQDSFISAYNVNNKVVVTPENYLEFLSNPK